MESDLLEVMVACTDNYLDTIDVKCSNATAVTVIAAASGYPGPFARNDLISIDHSGKLKFPFLNMKCDSFLLEGFNSAKAYLRSPIKSPWASNTK